MTRIEAIVKALRDEHPILPVDQRTYEKTDRVYLNRLLYHAWRICEAMGWEDLVIPNAYNFPGPFTVNTVVWVQPEVREAVVAAFPCYVMFCKGVHDSGDYDLVHVAPISMNTEFGDSILRVMQNERKRKSDLFSR